MARLSASERAKLPDSAFAYVDSTGKRRLPINDESHVRNALSRFSQVAFEDEDARETARRRLLNAAKRHGIVPVGFIASQLRSEARRSAAGRMVIELSQIQDSRGLEAELRRTLGDPSLMLLRWSKPAGAYVDSDDQPVLLPDDSDTTVTFMKGTGRPSTAIIHDPTVLGDPDITDAVMAAVHVVLGKELIDAGVDVGATGSDPLPDGHVSFLLTDIEGSTGMLAQLGDGYGELLTELRTLIRTAVLRTGGREVEARADEFVAVFEQPRAALGAAVAMQREIDRHDWPPAVRVRVRAGIGTGEITLTESGYIGMTVNTAARVMAAAHGGQVLACPATAAGLDGDDLDGANLRSLGRHELRGVQGEHEIFQVEARGLRTDFPGLRQT